MISSSSACADQTSATVPPISVPDRSYGGTPLDNCLYGALHGWSCDSAPCDYPATVRLLIEAGERVRPEYLPTGLDDVDAVLRAHLEGRRT